MRASAIPSCLAFGSNKHKGHEAIKSHGLKHEQQAGLERGRSRIRGSKEEMSTRGKYLKNTSKKHVVDHLNGMIR